MTTTNELSITIITAEEGNNLLYGADGDILYSNVKSYCDKKSLTKLKKELGIESKRRIRYVITHTKEHPQFKCKQNKKITYTNGVFVDADWEGATPYIPPSNIVCVGFSNSMATTKHPYGDIFISLEDDPEEKKKAKILKKISKLKSQLESLGETI